MTTVVPELGQISEPTGQSALIPDEPDSSGELPAAEDFSTPVAELGPTAAMAADAGAASQSTQSTLSAASGSTSLRDRIIALGMQYIGTPYKWGGTTPGGFDCSGILKYIFGKNGVSLPRVSYQQANYGTRTPLKDLQPGDLVAWDENSRNNGADHIALYIGNGQILEAPHTGANVRVRALGQNEGAWGVHLNLSGDGSG